MGIYIKGMDMAEIEKLVLTKNVQLIFRWTSDMKITTMTKTESDSGIVSYSKEFDVVKVPEPHGSLIDANECAVYREHYETYNDYSTAFDMIDSAPIIIEAEEK